ncbi:hypothetical protein Poly30_03700 [Planctomycetes bacterium Poly30]|uniref:Uncharacterized protein n=1 Tax=Saltatorellus ferox TaxID=2528018 RepID=A0A518ELA9_9BACT|nr:hypothetical protein Poly30_03700 [Planctomycetes bacterium Poly30]
MLTLAALILAPQVTVPARPILGPIQDAGVYDYATGTLYPPGTQSTSGPDSIYDNTASAGFYYDVASFSTASQATLSLRDVGGIPGPGNPGAFAAPADRAELLVNGFEFAYCVEIPGGTAGFIFFFSSGALSTTTPEVGGTAQIFVEGLPTGGTYRVRVDLGPSLSFCLLPDGGPQDSGFDGVPSMDRFTVTAVASNFNGGHVGLLLAGDPAATDASYLPPTQPLPRDGDGTYYGTAPSCAAGTTGYLTEDSLAAWIFPGNTFIASVNAGGYTSAGGCGTAPRRHGPRSTCGSSAIRPSPAPSTARAFRRKAF